MEPWGTPALTSDQSETCPFNKTLCFLFLRKSHKRFSKLPDIPFCFNLKTYSFWKMFFTGNQSRNKGNPFRLFLILMFEKSGLKKLILFMNNFYKHIFRSSYVQMFFKTSALKNLATLRIKKKLQIDRFFRRTLITSYFLPVNIVKLLRTAFIQNTSRSSRLQVFFKIDPLKSFGNFIEKHLYWSLFLKNLYAEGLQLY